MRSFKGWYTSFYINSLKGETLLKCLLSNITWANASVRFHYFYILPLKCLSDIALCWIWTSKIQKVWNITDTLALNGLIPSHIFFFELEYIQLKTACNSKILISWLYFFSKNGLVFLTTYSSSSFSNLAELYAYPYPHLGLIAFGFAFGFCKVMDVMLRNKKIDQSVHGK